MANVMYPSAKELLWTAGIDLANDDVKAALIDTDDVSYSASHEFLSDVSSGVVGTAVQLTNITYTGGVFDSDPVEFTTVTGDEFEAYIIYVDTGNAATSPLICWVDTGITGAPMTPNGGKITLTPHANGHVAL